MSILHGQPYPDGLFIPSSLTRLSIDEIRRTSRAARMAAIEEMREIMRQQLEHMLRTERFEHIADTELSLTLIDEFEAWMNRVRKRETRDEKRARLLAQERYEELARMQKRRRKDLST